MKSIMKRWVIRPDGLLLDAVNDFEVGHVCRNTEARLWEWRCIKCGRLETLSPHRTIARDALIAHCQREHALP